MLKEALRVRLQAKGWRVFLDSQSILGGDRWREDILHSLATAKAGIILLNEQATKSDWVKAEAMIMCFRTSIDRTFPVLPIILPDASIDATFLKTYEPFEFNEIQNARVGFTDQDTADAFAEKVAANANLERARQSEPRAATWVQKVADILSGVDHDALSRAAKSIELELEGILITPANREAACIRLRWALANLMHYKQAAVCLNALTELIDALTREKVGRLEPHIMSKWVENESVERLLLGLRKPEEQGLLALNTRSLIVADRYTQRLKIETPPPNIISTISVPQPNGDCDETILLGKVEEEIRKKLVPEPVPDESGNELSLDEAVSRLLERENRFALAVLPPQFTGTSLLKTLRGRFARIMFIAMAGDQGEYTAQCVAAGGRLLTPELTSAKRIELGQLSADWIALLDQHFLNQE